MSRVISFRDSQLKPGELTTQCEGSLLQYEIRDQGEVAEIMGLSRQRVQQIERSAILKLRRGLREEYSDLISRR